MASASAMSSRPTVKECLCQQTRRKNAPIRKAALVYHTIYGFANQRYSSGRDLHAGPSRVPVTPRRWADRPAWTLGRRMFR